MFGKSFDLFSVFGFKIRLDLSWFVIAALITWSLARQAFPHLVPGLGTATYWVMGVAGAVGLFVSVVAHEVSHAMVARRFDMEMRGITLFIFGGVAEMSDEPPSPKAEFWMAIAGPIMSFVVAGICAVVGLAGLPTAVAGVVGYLALINVILGVFNLIPAFPLDGGRVLRSILWQTKGDLKRATRITFMIGSGFGFALIGFGVLRVLVWGDLIGGVWMFLIGLFLRNAAQMSYQQLLLRRVLEGEPVSRFMQGDPVTVPRAISVEQLVEEYVYKYHFKMFPVVDGERLVGCVTTRQIKELPREEWDRTSVGALASGCSQDNTVPPGADAMEALATMNRNQASRLMVVEGDRLLGVLTLKDLLQFFSLKIELDSA